MNFRILFFNSSLGKKNPRLMTFLIKILNHISIWFIRDACLGVLGWDESLAGQGLELLKKRGIEVNLNTRVESYDGKRVTAFPGEQDLSVETDTLIWTAGTALSTELLTASGLSLERSGHIIIDEFLCVDGSENVFSVGDMTSLVAEQTGRLYPPVAPIAISQGVRAAANDESSM